MSKSPDKVIGLKAEFKSMSSTMTRDKAVSLLTRTGVLDNKGYLTTNYHTGHVAKEAKKKPPITIKKHS